MDAGSAAEESQVAERRHLCLNLLVAAIARDAKPLLVALVMVQAALVPHMHCGDGLPACCTVQTLRMVQQPGLLCSCHVLIPPPGVACWQGLREERLVASVACAQPATICVCCVPLLRRHPWGGLHTPPCQLV